MKTYINAISSISFQNLFEDRKLEKLISLDKTNHLIQPNYKQWIKPMQLRRMSKIVRMGLACTKDIEAQIGTNEFESIIVGTGLGCIKDTIKFIETINSVSTSSIPPTAFIQSTHNTIAGQIALLLSNNSYNMTYVQNGVSFEHALIDAHIKIKEGQNNILVGALDEMTEYIQELAKLAQIKDFNTYTEGAAFFNLVSTIDENTFAELQKTMTFTCGNSFEIDKTITHFLASENITIEDIDIVFQSSPKFKEKDKHSLNGDKNVVKYEDYCGKYFTSSAFGLYLACQAFKEKKEIVESVFGIQLNELAYSLVVNNYQDKVVGLTLLKNV